MTFLPTALEGKTAVVTGASRGLGRMIALALARAGASLALAGIEPEGNEQVAAEIRTLGRPALAIPADVNRAEDLRKMCDLCVETYGRIDILVNNAGISPIYKRAEQIPEEVWDKILQTNLKSVFVCSRLVAEVMRRQEGGKIVNISSVNGTEGSPRLAAYAASKAGVINLTRTLALEWAPYNINVNAVAPGYFEIGLGEPMLANERLRKGILDRIPLGRLGKREEISGAVVFLASGLADYITGQTLAVDGGWSA